MIPTEQPPVTTDIPLREYLSRMFSSINISFSQTSQLDISSTLPSKPSVGKVYYFKQAIPATSITSEGYWGYKSTGWVQLG